MTAGILAKPSAVFEFPATPTQQALWFTYRMNPASSAYNIPIAARLRGPLDEPALRQAFLALAGRHEILRTVFSERSGALLQVVKEEVRLDWRATSTAPEGDIEAFCRERAASVAVEPFDLETGPLVRISLERFSKTDALLTLVFHHIVIDHLSLEQCARELAVLYRERVSKGSPGLPPQEFQFADYAVWLADHQGTAEVNRKIERWKDRLKGFSGALALPTDFTAPALPTGKGAELRFSLGPPLAAAARSAARSNGVSLFTVTLGALKALLYRCSGQQDVIVGTPFANRSDEEALLGVVGCFINTLPIATDFSSIATFRELVQSVNRTVIEAFTAQDVPFEVVVNAVRPHRELGRNPLFQVGFVLQAPPVILELPGLTVEDVQVHSGGAMYDLHMWLWERDDGVDGLLWYDTDLFGVETMKRFLRRYEKLLAELTSSPDAPIVGLSFLPDEERVQLARWNEASSANHKQSVFPRRFEAKVAQQPSSPAVSFEGATLTYGELNARANQLARRLQAMGVGEGGVVAVCLPRSVDLAIALLGVQKSGGAYVPLDPDFPAERLSYMLADSGATVLVTVHEGVHGVELPEGIRVLDQRAEAAALAAMGSEDLPDAAQPQHPAYVIYTSGSTGRPKGVVVSHSNLLNFLESMQREPGLTAQDVLAAVTTISFDIAGLELYLPWLIGARVEMVSRETAVDGVALAAVLEQSAATVLQATPATWRLLLEAGWRGARGFKALCGGEPLPRSLADALLERVGELWNLYGPTETTIWSTLERIEPGASSISIGRPIANTQVHVLDGAGQLAPIGVPGELWIGGAGVALGYHRRAELTAERFTADRFSGKPGARLYRTGDLGRWRADGRLEHLGRLDNQVKIRGFRIELGEIEAVTAEHEAVEQVVVLARDFGPDDKRLVAYVSLRNGKRLTSTELRSHLRQALPEYMIPQLLVEVEKMPLTPNGKLDRLALPDPIASPAATRALVPPRTENEHRLAGIWSKALGVRAIGVDSNFFDLGGHSLLAMQVIFQIQESFGVRLNPRDLIMNSLQQLAARLPLSQSDSGAAPTHAVKRAGLLQRIIGRAGSG